MIKIDYDMIPRDNPLFPPKTARVRVPTAPLIAAVIGLIGLIGSIGWMARGSSSVPKTPVPGTVRQGRQQAIAATRLPSEFLLSLNNDGITQRELSDFVAPPGTIAMWMASSGATIPQGWVRCDGTNNTPDLRARFPLGYDVRKWNNGRTRDDLVTVQLTPGSTGGEAKVTLAADQIPSHTHTYSTYLKKTEKICNSSNNISCVDDRDWGTYTTDPVGNSSPVAHNNMPPYEKVIFIMKL